jgi:hypothetical protein
MNTPDTGKSARCFLKLIGEKMNKLIRNLLLVGIVASASALAATEEEAAAPRKPKWKRPAVTPKACQKDASCPWY